MAGINIYSSKVRPRRVFPINNFIQGIAKYDKDPSSGAFAFSRNANYRLNPREITIQPASIKESGGVTKDLPTWIEHVQGNAYLYDLSGNLYKRTSSGSHSLIRSVPDSQGNGLAYYAADDYLYYIGNKSFGRYGPISSTPQTFVDNYLASQGGVPTNTNSVLLVAGSSQYLKHADAAAFDITGDLAIEAYVKPVSLPAVGSTMTIVGKWDESTNHRSYKFDINAVSGFFGSGADSSLTISSNTTEAPIDAACSGTAGTTTLSATNASFAAGQKILIIQMQGNGAGVHQVTTIAGYTAGTITTQDQLNFSYAGVAQVRVLKQYTNVTINAGITYSAKPWNGTTGGILAFLCNGTLTVTGILSADGANGNSNSNGVGGGFRGGANDENTPSADGPAFQGESATGAGIISTSNNGSAGGGGFSSASGGGGSLGSLGTNGATGQGGNNSAAGVAGILGGSADLTTLVMGAGGGGGAGAGGNDTGGYGGNGGGIIFINAPTITITGFVSANGGNGGAYFVGNTGSGGGAGSGGSILINGQTVTLGTNLLSAVGGQGGLGNTTHQGSNGGNGGNGIIHLNYYTAYTYVSSTPTVNITQDNTLVTNTTYQMRLGISDNGTAFEYLTQNLPIATGSWQGRLGVSWKASTSTASFYQGGNPIGTVIGTKTSIANNASEFSIGANKGASAYQNFFDGYIDDVRLWNTTRTNDQMLINTDIELGGGETGLAAYYKFNANANDTTSGGNNLTNVNTATFPTDVPFSSPTTRQDIDQTSTPTGGQTYSVPTTLTEGDKISFVPAKDPQKSISLDIAAKGTGDWTVTIHNGLNQQVATVTVPNASLPSSGFYEFIFTATYTPVVGATYHAHVYSTVNDGTLNTHTSGDITTSRYTTYYQFLKTELYHPALQVVNVLGIGNGRYLATYDAAAGYNPMRLSFPPEWHVRCIARWRNKFMIGCWKGTNISDFDQGIIFVWNGYDITYEDFIEVPQGGINAMIGMGDELWFVAGYKGTIMKYDGSTRPQQVRQIPKMTQSDTIEALPGAMTVWNKLVHIGVALSSTSTQVQRGIYSYGNNFDDEVESLSYDHVISTGNYGTTVQIGAILPVNGKLLVGWKDNKAPGVDVIDPLGNPAPNATIEGLVTDFGFRWKEKQGLVARADFKPLRTGEQVIVKYRPGYNSNWIVANTLQQGPDGATPQGVGQTYVRLPIPDDAGDGRHHEFQIGVDLISSPQGSSQSLSTTPSYERGTALSGLEFGSAIPGVNGADFYAPVEADFSYFAAKGMTIIRLPVLWERLQPTLNGALDPTYKGFIDNAIVLAKKYNMRIILDIHNFGRYNLYADGGITELFTETPTSLTYPYADYTQSGSIVLRNYGQAYLGTFNNPVSPATGYKVTFNMKFNSKDDSFGHEGLHIKPMWRDDNNCYDFEADIADNTWVLSKIVNGVTTQLATGSKTWGTTNTYAISIDVNQATNGFINVSIGGTPLFTTNSIASDTNLVKGKIAFMPQGVHVQLDTLVLNVNGDTSSGGLHQYRVGDAQVPISAFANLWSQIAAAYNNESGIFMYDLMNEWHDMPVPLSSSTYNSTATVTLANQAAITAIRAVENYKYIAIESDQYSGIQNFTNMYGSNPSIWWSDPQNKTMISFHYYQDTDHSGTYVTAWSSTLRTRISGDLTPALSWAQSNNVPVYMGEFGVPNGNSSDDVNWQTDLGTVLTDFDTYSAYATQWAGGVHYTSITTLEPTNNYLTDQAQMAILQAHPGKINNQTQVSVTTAPTLLEFGIYEDLLITEEEGAGIY